MCVYVCKPEHYAHCICTIKYATKLALNEIIIIDLNSPETTANALLLTS